MIAFLLCACGFFEKEYFSEEQQNYQQYLAAKNSLQEQNYSIASEQFEKLWKRTNSRAILENLVEVYRLNGEYEKGFALVSSHLKNHPGDFELRLMKAKLLLGMERWEEAKGELQIILFNKKMSVWELIQDPDLKIYKHKPELEEVLGFSTIQIRQLHQPDGGLTGDVLLLDLQINHLRGCELLLEEVPKTEYLKIQKIRIDSRNIDLWVKQTQLQINWRAMQEGVIPSFEIPVRCDDDSLLLSIKSMTIEELVKTKNRGAKQYPMILLPKTKDCVAEEIASSEDTIPVQFRINGFLDKECRIFP